MLADKPLVLNPNFSPPWFGRILMARKASARYVSPPRAPVTSESLGTALRSGSSCQENKRILVKIHPQGKQSGPKKIQTEDKSIFANQSLDRENLRLVTIEEGCGEDFVEWRPRF